MKFLFLILIISLVSLGVAIQYADASIFNERVSSNTASNTVDDVIYTNVAKVQVRFDFTGDGTSVDQPRSRNIDVTNGVIDSGTSGGRSGTSSFYHQYFVNPSNHGLVTVTYPANSFTINSISNDAITYTFFYDNIRPSFVNADFSTVELNVGDYSPTLSTLQCSDTNSSTPSALRSGSVNVNLAGDYPVEYTCEDHAGNSNTQTKLYKVVALATTSVEITPIPYDKTNIGTYSFTIILGDSVTGFDPFTDVTLSDGGRIDSFSKISGTQYTVNTAGYSQGDVTVIVQADAFTDFSNAETSYLFTYDTTKPVIVYAGSNPVSVNLDANYDIPSLDCTDNSDATKKSQSSGTVDTSTADDYTIHYSCIDLAGNAATPLDLVVGVMLTPSIPVITTPTSGSSSLFGYVTIEGTGEPGIKIAICLVDGSNCHYPVTIGNDGHWIKENFALFNGKNTLKLIYMKPDGVALDIYRVLDSPTVTVTYNAPFFTDLIVDNIKSSLNPNGDQIIYHHITTPSNVVSLYGTSVPNIKLDLIHITGYDNDPSAKVLFTSGTVIETFVSNGDGTWQSSDFTLNAGSNIFILRGYDKPSNQGLNVAVVTYNPAVDAITVGDKEFLKPELTLKDSTPPVKIIPEPDPPKKKKSSSNNDYWTRAPTFGSHHQTNNQQVDYGFTFNGQKITIENNYHVDIDKINAKVGNNTATIKVFAQDPLRNVSLYLGIPTNLDTSGAETQIELVLYKNNTVSSGYTVKQVNHHQEEPLIDETATYGSTHKVNCNDTDTLKKCHSFTINFRVMAPLMYDHTAITAYDVSGRSQTTFINDGIEFHGAQLSEPSTHTIPYKKGNQHDVQYYNLEQTDRRNNIWSDQLGNIWTHNEHGTWKKLSISELKRTMDLPDNVIQYYIDHKNNHTPVVLNKVDPDVNVVTRIHSSFGGMIQDEKAKALQVFDTTKDLKQYTKTIYTRSVNDTGITSALSRDDSGFVNLIYDEQSKALIILGVSPQDQEVSTLSAATYTRSVDDTGIVSALTREDPGFVNLLQVEQSKALFLIGAHSQSQDPKIFVTSKESVSVTYDSDTYVIALDFADGIVSGLTRDDSGFESLLQSEHDKALQVLDATTLKQQAPETHTISKSNYNVVQILDREDPGFQKLLQDEHNKALMVFDARDLLSDDVLAEIITKDHNYSGMIDLDKLFFKLIIEQQRAQEIIDRYYP